MRMPSEETCFAGTTSGLERVLADEARALGRVAGVQGGVEVTAAPGLHQEMCLRLRTSTRVLLQLARLPPGGWERAAEAVARVDLRLLAPPGEPVWLESTVRAAGAPGPGPLRSWLARRWRRPVHEARGVDRLAGTRLVLQLLPGGGTLGADAAGEPLYRRGWRQEVGRAPMRETLAAGMLALAGWRDDEPLWDPMCGSGTVLIEAALRARRLVPGLGRAFAFERWAGHDPWAWAARRERAGAEALPAAPAALRGSDVNAGALGTARRNARRAGVLGDLRLERADVRTLGPGGVPPGLLAANLPFGKRLGDRSALGGTFQAVAGALGGQFRAWRAALLTRDPDRLVRTMGRPASAVHPLDHGGLAVALCLFPPAVS